MARDRISSDICNEKESDVDVILDTGSVVSTAECSSNTGFSADYVSGQISGEVINDSSVSY